MTGLDLSFVRKSRRQLCQLGVQLVAAGLLSACQSTPISAPEKPAAAAHAEETVAPSTEATPTRAETLPPKALIIGVPFISWHDAAKLDYQDKPILNPSVIARMAICAPELQNHGHGHEGLG